MPSRRKSASKKMIIQPVRAGRIAKDKSATTTTHAQPRAMSLPHTSSSRSSTPSRSDSIDRLGNMDLNEMGLQIRPADTATFDQLMERLDGMSNVLAPASR